MTPPTDGYPLQWPVGWPRREPYKRNSSPYQVEFAKARDELVRELRLAGARDIVISSNIPLRRDGLPLAGMAEPKDPGVAVYFTNRKKAPCCIPNDAWRTVRENVRGIGYAVAALRMLERCGSGEVIDRAYAGYALLPETAGASNAWALLGLAPGSSPDEIKTRYRELSRIHHPDRPGGTSAGFTALTEAYNSALAEVGRAR
jgi:hypothetical protein